MRSLDGFRPRCVASSACDEISESEVEAEVSLAGRAAPRAARTSLISCLVGQALAAVAASTLVPAVGPSWVLHSLEPVVE